MMEKLIDRFDAADGAGETYTVSIFQQFVDQASFDRPDAPPLAALKRVEVDGNAANVVGQDTYRLLNGTVIRRTR